jgi:hypothetical protein
MFRWGKHCCTSNNYGPFGSLLKKEKKKKKKKAHIFKCSTDPYKFLWTGSLPLTLSLAPRYIGNLIVSKLIYLAIVIYYSFLVVAFISHLRYLLCLLFFQ